MPNFPFTVGDSLRIGSATISASGNAVVLPTGTQVGNQNVATTVEVSTGGGPKITNLQVTSNVYVVLDDTAVDLTGGFIKITGTNFVSGCMVYVASTPANSTTFVSTTEVRAQLPATAAGTYPVYLVNPDGGTAIRVPGVTFSASPAWQTASSLGEQYDGVVLTLPVVATDATVYTLTSGSLPPGLSLNSNTGVISGTVSGVANDTVYSFTITATDAQLQDSPRTFTVTITVSDPYFKLTTLLLSASSISANTVVRDSSTNNFNLTVFGDARASNFTPYGTGWSNYFDGSGDWLVTSNVGTTTGDFTLELWCYLDSSQPQGWYPYVFGTNSPWQGSGGIGLVYNTQSGVADGTPLSFNVAGGGITVDTHSNLKSRWVHLALTRSGSTIRAFLNGTVLASTLTNSSTINTSTFMIGGVDEGGSYGNHAMKCWISNFRFVKGSALYTANFTPATSSLTSVTDTALLICQSNRFVDNSANNYSLSRSGDVKIDSFNPFNITNTGVNGSMYFDGTGDYVTAPSNAAFGPSGDFTFESWLYWTGGSNENTLFCVDVSGGINIGLAFGTGGANWGIGRRAIAVDNEFGTAPIKFTWNHLAVSRQSGTIRAFVNGRLVFSGANTVSYVAGPPGIAGIATASTNILQGYISDARFVSAAVYTANFTPATSSLTAIANTQLLTLQYDQPHNNHTFLDSSSNQFLITRSGNATQGTFSPFSPNGWSNFYNSTQTNWPDTTWNTLAGITFTIECWLYPIANGAVYGGMILGNNVSGRADATWFFFSDTAKVGIGTAGSSNWTGFNSTNSVQLNSWSHVAITIDGPSGSATAKIYINGVLDSTHLNRSTNIPTNIGNCLTGTRGDGSQYNYYGYISNLRITKNQVLYTGNFTPPTAALTTSTVGTTGANVASSITGTVSAILYGGERLINKVGSTRPDSNSSVIQAFSPFAPTAVYNPVAHGGSAYFDGSGDYLTVPYSSALDLGSTDFTIEWWMYPQSNNDQVIVVQSNDLGTYGPVWIRYTSGTLRLYATTANGTWNLFNNTVISGTIALNQWAHCALTRTSAGVWTLYVNGVSAWTATAVGSLYVNSNATVLGGSSSAGFGYIGYLSSFRIVKGTIVYTGAFTPPTATVTTTTNTQLLLNFTDAAILDSTGRNVIETSGDAKVTTVQTKFGTSSQFYNGSNTNLVVPVQPYFSFPGTTSFTVEAWVYFNDLNTQLRTLIALGDGANGSGPIYNAWSMQYWGTEGSNQISWGRYDGTSYTYLTSGLSLVANTWYHIAVSRDSANTLRIFVNGTSYYSATVTQTFAQINSNPLRIGLAYNGPQTGYGGPRYFNGYIDDIRITQGYARYTANFTAPTVPARLK